VRFQTTILQARKTATGIVVPPEVVEALGAGKKPAVVVTIAGHTYRSTVAPRADRFLIPLSGENRTAAGVAAGDEVEVDIELDTAPRTIDVPPDLAAALAADVQARQFFDGLSYSQQGGYVTWIESAKKAETRAARIPKAVELLREGRKQR
jgi:hypothetical protein